MVTKLQLFNGALDELGEVNVSDTGEQIHAARVLVRRYDRVRDHCLASAPWNFAMETSTETSAGSTPALGYAHTFAKPSDWITTDVLATDSGYETPLLAYYEDADYWAADTGQIFVRYVSDDTGKGLDLAAWPAKFTRWFEAELALEVHGPITGGSSDSPTYKDLVARAQVLKREAIAHDSYRQAWPNFTSTANSKARLIHKALIELGDVGKISTSGEDPRRVLNRLYDDVVAECIASAPWNFAMETSTETSAGSTPALGYAHTFAKPSDWVATEALTEDSGYAVPLISYYEDDDYWAADTGQIFVRYVSNDTGKGNDLAAWPAKFTRWVELKLAARAAAAIGLIPENPELLPSRIALERAGPDVEGLPQGRAEGTGNSGGDRAFALSRFLQERAMEAKTQALAADVFRPPWPNFSSTVNSKARLIHKALIELGDVGKISIRGEDPRRVLNRLYDDVVAECIASAPWNFAMETSTKTADTGLQFGYAHTFTKPSDWVATEALTEDSGYAVPLISYYEDDDYWAADTGQIFVRYVSNDTGKGNDLAAWPAKFTRWVELKLAARAAAAIEPSQLENAGPNAEGTKNLGKDRAFALSHFLQERAMEAKTQALAADVFRPPWPNFTSTTNSKARLIHKALIELGDVGKISIHGDDPRRVLAKLYDDVVADCLSAGSWNFAMETIKTAADTGVTPEFGYTEVFAKPSDWVRTIGISEDEYFSVPLLHYYDDANFWSADSSPIYVRYVSDDTGLGLELTRWPAAFRRYVELELAACAAEAISHMFIDGATVAERTRSVQIAANVAARLKIERDKAKTNALAQDAMNEPQPKFPPSGSWTNVRGGRSGWGDRGNRNKLIG